MIAIRPITPEDAHAFRDVRLRALQEAPLAFGSTYAQESRLTEAEWAERVRQRDGRRARGFLAWDEEVACGIIGVFLDETDPARAHVVSMWVAPTHRRRGVGRQLIDAAASWARARGVGVLSLLVTSSNTGGIRFYERLGFTMTGRTEPYPNDPALVEFEMMSVLSTAAGAQPVKAPPRP